MMRALKPFMTALLINGSNDPVGTSLRCQSIVPMTRNQPNTSSFENIWRRYRQDGHNSGGFIYGNSRHLKLQSCRLSKLVTLPPARTYDSIDFDGLTRVELQVLCKERKLRAVGKTCELVSRLRDYEEQLKQQHNELNQPAEQVPTCKHLSKNDCLPLPEENVLVTVSGEDDSLGASSATNVPELSIVPVELQHQPLSASAYGADDYRNIFPELSGEQWAKVKRLGELLVEWNGRVNLISRNDIANVMPHHIIPCLAVAKAINFPSGDLEVLDVGTGGGLPGLPMAIYYPNVHFTLIDGTGKKIQAVKSMAEQLGLTNVRAFHTRAEDVHEPFDFVIGRAVTSLPKFVDFIETNLKRNDVKHRRTLDRDADTIAHVEEQHAPLKRGVLYMRGEVSREELDKLGAEPSMVFPLKQVLEALNTATGEGASDKGYSSVFHFTSEAIWNRVPRAANGRDRPWDGANRQ